jgi:hypothetical protein
MEHAALGQQKHPSIQDWVSGRNAGERLISKGQKGNFAGDFTNQIKEDGLC